VTSAPGSLASGDRKAEVERRIDALTADLGIRREQVAEIALRYVLSESAVSAVIPGMRTVRNVERNTSLSESGLPASQRDVIARHRWEKNFYGS
jgi:aryl-alcohol dehydrogenase-like predicted oxidoreductase